MQAAGLLCCPQLYACLGGGMACPSLVSSNASRYPRWSALHLTSDVGQPPSEFVVWTVFTGSGAIVRRRQVVSWKSLFLSGL